MQKHTVQGFGRPARRAGPSAHCPARGRAPARLILALVLLLLPARAAAAEAHSALLEGLKQTLHSRWDFQKRHPLAAKAFVRSLSEAERAALVAGLAAEPTRMPVPAEGAAPGAVSLPDLWREFTLGLCAEVARPGSGEAELGSAARRAQGSVPVTYELARILQGMGMYQRASAFQKEVQRALLEQGYARAPELAKMELRRAREALSEGRHQAARHSREFAGRLDPFSPWVPFFDLELHLRANPPWAWDPGEVWARLGETAALVRHYDSMSLFLLNLSRIVRLGLGLFGAVCLAALCARHFFRMAHPLAERLPQPVEMRVRYLALAMVPVSLAVGGAGYAVLALLATALLWRHCSLEERAILKAVLTGLAILPILLVWEGTMGRHLDPKAGIHLYHRAYERGLEPALAARINETRPVTAEDTLYRSLAGSLLFKKQGNLKRASEGARDALTLQPGSALAAVHAGNVHLLAFDNAKAATMYAAARDLDPAMVEAWFNASQAELYGNNSGKHKQYLDRAAELDPQRVTAFLQTNDALFPSVPPNRKAMDPMLGAAHSWKAAWTDALDLGFLRVRVRMGILEAEGWWLVAASLLTSLGLWFRFRNWSPAVHGRDLFACKICGRTMCRTCRKGVHCQACFKAAAGIQDTRVRSELVHSLRVRAERNEARTARALDLAFPGAGLLYSGTPSAGRFAWPLAMSMALGLLFGVRDLVMEYPSAAVGFLSWLPALCVIAVYAAHHVRYLPFRTVRGNGTAAPVREREAAA